MKRLNSISLFRIIFFIIISAVFNNIYTIIASITILTLFNYKETTVYLLFCILIYLSFYIQNVDFIKNFEISNPIRQFLLNKICTYKECTQSVLKLILFNENDYSNIYNLSYGLTSYYLIKTAGKKKHLYSFILIFIFSVLFGFNRKYLLIIGEYFIEKYIKEKRTRKLLVIFLIMLISPNIRNDNSFFIVLLIKSFSLFKTDISFEMFLFNIESLLFGYVDILSLFMFRYLILIRSFIYIFSIILLIIPKLENTYLKLINLYSDFNTFFSMKITGKLTLISIVMLASAVVLLKIRNRYIQALILSCYLLLNLNVPYATVSFIDVGQGDAILIKNQFNMNTVLIDTGSNYSYYRLNKYLNEKSVKKIDYLVITHEDEDHSGNKDYLLNDFSVEEVVEEGKDIEINNINLKYLNCGRYDNDNDNSLVYFTEIGNLAFLFTGDISKQAELAYVEQYGYEADILKVSHHGSKTASSEMFVSEVMPKISIISTNGKYNHPADETTDTLNRYMSRILSTKKEGDIEFIFIYKYCIVKTNSQWFVII